MEITAKHLKSARILLDWSQKDLAKHSGVSVPTIQRMESTSEGRVRGNYESVSKVQKALENAGIDFVDEPRGHGVLLKPHKGEHPNF